MSTPNEPFEIPGRVRIEPGQGGLKRIIVTTPQASAEIYTHGAHVTHFEPVGQPPVLWMSKSSWFDPSKPIRGGVPICFPWFGPRAGDPKSPAHGFARLREWRIVSTKSSDGGPVTVILQLTHDDVTRALWPADFIARYVITIGAELTMELTVENTGKEPIRFEQALHTYLTVGDIKQVAIEGLAGTQFIDKVDGAMLKHQSEPMVKFSGETDRVYLNTTSTCAIYDPVLRRRIEIAKNNSDDTVVWNPWINKAKAMPDFGDEEWPGMACVETANVAGHAVELPAGQTHTMSAKVRAWPIK